MKVISEKRDVLEIGSNRGSRDWIHRYKELHGSLSGLDVLVRVDEIVSLDERKTAAGTHFYWQYITACQVNLWNMIWSDEIETSWNLCLMHLQPTKLL